MGEQKMVELDLQGRYRGRFGPDPKKRKVEREAELHGLVASQEGTEIILYLWKEAKGIPAGTAPDRGTLVRAEMIPELLAHEYPNG